LQCRHSEKSGVNTGALCEEIEACGGRPVFRHILGKMQVVRIASARIASASFDLGIAIGSVIP
jgi:hypothetical protein